MILDSHFRIDFFRTTGNPELTVSKYAFWYGVFPARCTAGTPRKQWNEAGDQCIQKADYLEGEL